MIATFKVMLKGLLNCNQNSSCRFQLFTTDDFADLPGAEQVYEENEEIVHLWTKEILVGIKNNEKSKPE